MHSISKVRMLLLCMVLQLVVVAARASVIFEDCGSAYRLTNVNIEGCNFRLPCFVTLGDRITVNMEFFADFVSRQLDQDVILDINYIHASTTVTPEPCATVMCPVRTYAITSLTSIMSVPTNMALNKRGYLYWRVHNEEGKQVLCYSVLVQTQNYVQKFLRALVPDTWDANSEPNEEILNEEHINKEYFYELFQKYNGNNTYVN